MIESQNLFFQMTKDYRNLPCYSDETTHPYLRANSALDLFAQSIFETVEKFADENGNPKNSVAFVSRIINIVEITLKDELAQQILALDEKERKNTFPNVDRIISSNEMNKKITLSL